MFFQKNVFFVFQKHFRSVFKKFTRIVAGKLSVTFTQFSKNNNILNRETLIDNVVSLKRKIGFLKTQENVRKTVLRRYNDNINMTDEKIQQLTINTQSSFNRTARLQTKSINATSKFKLLFQKNRNIFRYFFEDKKVSRQFSFDKKFNNFFKKNFFKVLQTFEYTLFNILLSSSFVFSKKNFLFLLDISCVYLNGISVETHLQTVKLGDVVQLSVSNETFFMLRSFCSQIERTRLQASALLWRLNRFSHNVYKQKATHVPRWVDKLLYTSADIPAFLEVDYTVFAIIILRLPYKIEDFNWYSWKFLNFSLLRLYSWRYII